MKKLIPVVASILLSTTVSAANTPAFKTEMDKFSYSVGVDLGKNLKRQGVLLNTSFMAKGIEDAMHDGPFLLTEEQMKDVLNKFQKEFLEKRAADFNQKADENKKKGAEFLAQNKTQKDVVTLPSGLQYKIVSAGTGPKPKKNDLVSVEYTGKLINGQVFDSTDKTGKPVTFKLSQVIPGWTEALQLMPAGSTWELYVPPNLAYGARSVGGLIGPNETLIFTVHLIAVVPDDDSKPAS